MDNIILTYWSRLYPDGRLDHQAALADISRPKASYHLYRDSLLK